jgi:hypothetical protein
MLLDNPSSPGLLVRPRPGRLELCGDFADGPRLAAAIAFAVGSVRATILDRRAVAAHALDVHLEPAVERYGWYLDRAAFGTDLYAEGRDALLRLRSGVRRSAADQLTAVMPMVRRGLEGIAGPADHEVLADYLAGGRPLAFDVGELP